MKARILPDGIISIHRYPLSITKRLAQYARKLRRLIAPELDYWCFSGDRIGSDAPFCDRIYVIPGLPHNYPADKVVVLPPLVTVSTARTACEPGVRRPSSLVSRWSGPASWRPKTGTRWRPKSAPGWLPRVSSGFSTRPIRKTRDRS